MKPNGQLLDCTEAEYRAIVAANYSVLKHANRSAAHMRAAMEPREPSTAMLLGSLVDRWLFHESTLPEHFLRMPDGIDRRTKAGKEAWEQFQTSTPAGCHVIDGDTWDRAAAMVSAIRGNKTARAMFGGNQYQQPMVWIDPDTGVRCKGLLDSVLPGVTITDLKSTQNADWREFARTAASFSYHVQAAFYCDGWRECTGETLPYTFVVVESTAPWGVAVYRLDDVAIDAGRARYKAALQMYRDCTLAKCWPGYPEQLQTLELPKWALGGVPIGTGADHPF